MFFLWCSEWSAIISLNDINQLVFLIDTKCVLCEVLTELFNLDNHQSSKS
jgi:hypothetical protein